jgi:hypothetical protein
MPKEKYLVNLTDEERAALKQMLRCDARSKIRTQAVAETAVVYC